MYRLLLLIAVFPMISYAQQSSGEEFYLNRNGEIVTEKSDIICKKNKDLSRGYAACYDCMNAENVLIKQVNTNLHVSPDLKTPENAAFIKKTESATDYLSGEFKDGKPFNGFFQTVPGGEDWLMFDFYQHGQLISQLYNNKPHTILEEKDTELAYTTLDAKNSFKDGVLTDGIKLQDVKLRGGVAEIISYMEGGKTKSFLIGIFGMHYGEFIEVKPREDGILFESKGRGGVRITYQPEGRKMELLDMDQKPLYIVDFKHYDLADLAGLNQQEAFSYIRKDSKIYVEQVIQEKALNKNEEEDRDNQSSMLNNLSMHFYSKTAVTAAMLENILKDKHWGSDVFYGRHFFSEGHPIGMVYTNGDNAGKYNVEFITSPESPEKKFSLKNLSPAQILTELRATDH